MAGGTGARKGAAGGGGRWWWSRRRRRAVPNLDLSRPDLVVVASSFDDAEAASAVLARAAETHPRWQPADQAVLRHHLLLPARHVEDAVAVAGQDGYVAELPRGPVDVVPVAEPPRAPVDEVPDGRTLVLVRVQLLDALSCSQERSRMAGLAQRRDGVALGWDALQPSPGTGAHDRS